MDPDAYTCSLCGYEERDEIVVNVTWEDLGDEILCPDCQSELPEEEI